MRSGRAPGPAFFAEIHFFFQWWPLVQNWLFWAAVFFGLIFIKRALIGDLPWPLLPVYVISVTSARIALESQMVLAAVGGPLAGSAQIDPFSYAHLTSYFVVAFLLFPIVVVLASRLPFREIFRLSSIGFFIILIPPFVDYYVLKRPSMYAFLTLQNFTTVMSSGLRFEIAVVGILVFSYLFYRTRSIWRSALSLVALLFAFLLISMPTLLPFGISSSEQLFARDLILTYVLMMAAFYLYDQKTGSLIIRGIRLRGVHFPAMALFGMLLVHPATLATNIARDVGSVAVALLIVFFEWQTATVFDDVYDRGLRGEGVSSYLAYGILMALTALLSSIPFGALIWLLTLLGVYLIIDYARVRRRHFLLSGTLIGIGSSLSFLFGTLIPLQSPASQQPAALLALAIFILFCGGSLVKDIASVEEDSQSGIETVFTRYGMKPLPVVATFVAAGCMLPIVFLDALPDLILSLGMAIAAWLLIVLTKNKAYRPVLVLYFIEGAWIFFRMFVVH